MYGFEFVGKRIVEIPHWREELPPFTTKMREISAFAPRIILPALTELAEKQGATHYTLYVGKIPGRKGCWLVINGYSEFE